jgi:hypothetical protein
MVAEKPFALAMNVSYLPVLRDELIGSIRSYKVSTIVMSLPEAQECYFRRVIFSRRYLNAFAREALA